MHANTEYDEISDMPETRASSMGNDLKGLFRFENSKHPSWNYFKNFLCKKKKKIQGVVLDDSIKCSDLDHWQGRSKSLGYVKAHRVSIVFSVCSVD